MRIAHDVLRRYVDLPDDPRVLRELLDDLGFEVKRVESGPEGAIFTLELLANRGDHHAYEGVAREISARTGHELRLPASATLETGESPWPIRTDTPLCLRYTATLLERTDAEDASLSPEALEVLEAAGIHSLGPAIDATNLANLELGQPTHAFDADRIEGAVVIRLSRPGERAWPLFREAPVELPEGTLVIADDVKILAIAGVIGCEESKTTPETRRLLLESATFDPVAVRKASRALGIHTDSSARFERGADPTRALLGAGRVVYLLENAGWRRVGSTGVVGDWTDPEPVVDLDLDAADRFLGTSLSTAEAVRMLEALGFGVTAKGRHLSVQIPPRRQWDVRETQDLYEELLRITGYDLTPIALPAVEMGSLPSPARSRRSRVDEVLTGLGFYEVVTDGFYGREVLDLLDLDEQHPLWRHVETLNALDRGYSLLKNNALAQAVGTVAVNVNRRMLDLKAFEWTRTFHPRSVETSRTESPATERELLWLVANGRAFDRAWAGEAQPADVHYLTGVLRELSVELGLDLRPGPADPDLPLASCLHPGRQATITLDGKVVGILGEIHPGVVRRARIKGARPYYLEIEAEALLSEGRPPVYVEPPVVQPIERNLAFTLPPRFEAGRVAEHLQAEGPTWLERVDIVDVYAHDDTSTPVRTITYALRYSNEDAQRTADEVNRVTQSLIDGVHHRFGDQGVRLR